MADNRQQGGGIWRGVKRRLLSLALLALLVQATLPYLTTTCPVYEAVGQTAKVASPAAYRQAMADCPLMAMPRHAAQPDADGDQGVPHKAHAMCALCTVMSPLHAFVVAGLIALPPPAIVDVPVSFTVNTLAVPQPRVSAFSARAPPLQA